MIKSISSLLVLALILLSCGKKGTEETSTSIEEGDSKNQALYDQIMDIHDEVMPKTEELYNITKQLKTNLETATTDAEKELLQNQIQYFDSVDHMMMDWMHDFRPLPDTTNEQEVLEYYEDNLEKIKKVKEAILTALDQGKN